MCHFNQLITVFLDTGLSEGHLFFSKNVLSSSFCLYHWKDSSECHQTIPSVWKWTLEDVCPGPNSDVTVFSTMVIFFIVLQTLSDCQQSSQQGPGLLLNWASGGKTSSSTQRLDRSDPVMLIWGQMELLLDVHWQCLQSSGRWRAALFPQWKFDLFFCLFPC